MERTKVIFRDVAYDTGDKEILALFPEMINEYNGLVECYAHTGQHSQADYHYIIRISKPAKPEQYAPLLKELKSIGYVLDIKKRYSFNR